MFNIQDIRNECSALYHQGSSLFKVQGLTRPQFDGIAKQFEKLHKIGFYYLIKVVIIDTQSTTQVDVLQEKCLFQKLIVEFVRFKYKRSEWVVTDDLRSDMLMNSGELDMPELLDDIQHIVQLPWVDAKFVLLEPCCNVEMILSVNIRIEPNAYRCFFAGMGCRLVDDFQFLN